MNHVGKLTLGALLLLAVAAAGYWLGMRQTATTQAVASAAKSEHKVLYYRNPMGLPDTSPVPKKDAMGMDYVPVYQGEDVGAAASQLNLSIDKVQKLGVKSEAATLRVLHSMLRVTGRIEIDERRIYTIAPKFEGWVERLYVNTTGQPVAKGQPLFEVYSPELVSAQREQALAAQGLAKLKDADEEAQAGMRQLAEASRARLRNWDIADQRGDAKSHVTFQAPVSGVVVDKKAVHGMRFMPGETLYQIADLSSLWVIAELNEQDVGQVQVGGRAQVIIDAWPERSFDGKVDFIYPTLNAATRTVQVRILLANPGGLLKPAMFAHVELPAGNAAEVLAVPASAVIDSGARQVVLVRLAEGRFEPRVVKLGQRSADYTEVLSGVVAGEQVVTSANFLIDAESNLKAALSGMSERVTAGAASAENTNRQQAPSYKAVSVAHQGQGKLNAINPDGTVSITHEAIQTLGWPGMKMDFALANAALMQGVRPGSAITFEIVERAPGEWVITRLTAQAAQHEGH